jgi:hypothetical protein
MTASLNSSSNITGGPEPTTAPTTSQNIIAQHTTLKSAKKSSLQNSFSMPYTHLPTEHHPHQAKALSK